MVKGWLGREGCRVGWECGGGLHVARQVVMSVSWHLKPQGQRLLAQRLLTVSSTTCPSLSQLFAGGRALKAEEVESSEDEEEQEGGAGGSSDEELGSDEEGEELSDSEDEEVRMVVGDAWCQPRRRPGASPVSGACTRPHCCSPAQLTRARQFSPTACLQGGPRTGRRNPQQQVVMAADGRMRRRAVFGDDALPGANGAAGASSDEEGSDEEDEEEGSSDEEDDEAAGAGWQQRQQRGAAGAGSDSDDQSEEEEEEDGEESEEDDEGLGAAARWKAHMLERAAALFRCGWRLGEVTEPWVWRGSLGQEQQAGVVRSLPWGAVALCACAPQSPHAVLHLPPPTCRSTRGADLHSYIYGTRATADVSKSTCLP